MVTEALKRGRVIQNALRCDTCLTVLVSMHNHDFRACPCGVFNDGGLDYFRRGVPEGHTFTELSLILLNGRIHLISDLEKVEKIQGAAHAGTNG